MAKLKILFVSANSVPGAPLSVDAEFKTVRRQLRGRKSCDVRHNPSATLEDVIDEIKDYRPDIVHFSAHGSPSEEIVLNNDAGKPKAVPTKAFEQLFKIMKGNVRLVVMNSCFSARQAKAIAKFIDCVVGVKLRLADDVAIKFSPRFYETLAEGASVASAYETAMISVYGERPDNEQVPRLFKGRVRPEKITFLRALSAHSRSSPRPARPAASALHGKVGKTKKTVEGVDMRASEDGCAAPARCQSLHWDIKIDEEGDAFNDMTYKGIILPPKRPYVFELPAAEVQSGHTSEFELIWDGRTTEGASLKRGNIVSSTKIEMNVRFVNRPTSNSPASFAVRCWDWNVYSMNMEEFLQKPSWSEDGLDYAEKHVPEQWQSFTLLIQFPQQIVFAKGPFFEIYNPSDKKGQVRNDELTRAYQHSFYYSSSLNLALLFVEHPPSPFSYRISWLLGEGRVSVASALTPRQRQRQQTFAQRLLLMRRTLEGDKEEKISEAMQVEQGVNAVLASVAEQVQKLLGGAVLDPAGLEISLMVLDEDRPEEPPADWPEERPADTKKFPVLRIVAGTLLRDEGYRSLAFFVGDGNAGRAWKRKMARVFDLDEKDPKRHIYVPVPDSLCHRFLVSVPLIDPDSDALIYGILNIGTFTDGQAELLRKIGSAQEVQSMTSYAQSYVLKRLMELVRL